MQTWTARWDWGSINQNSRVGIVTGLLESSMWGSEIESLAIESIRNGRVCKAGTTVEWTVNTQALVVRNPSERNAQHSGYLPVIE